MIPLFLFLVCIYTVDNLFYTCPCTLCCMNLYLYYKSHDYSTIRPATAESLRSTTPHHPHLHMDRGLWLEITGTKRYSMVSNTIPY